MVQECRGTTGISNLELQSQVLKKAPVSAAVACVTQPPAILTSAESCRERKAEGKEGAGSKGAGVLYWLRQDFRLHDNPALSAAAQAAKKQACA